MPSRSHHACTFITTHLTVDLCTLFLFSNSYTDELLTPSASFPPSLSLFFITLYCSGDVVSTLYNGMPGGSYFHIANNRFWNGGTTHWGIEWKQCIYENNIATGVSVTAMGSNYPQYDHNDGNPHVQNIYHFNNSQNMIWGNDREMMTSDAGGGVYWGAVVPQETSKHPQIFNIQYSIFNIQYSTLHK